MLRTRILTALIIAPAALAAIFLLSVEDFRWFILGLVVLSGWEWANFIRLGTLGRWLYGFGLGVLLYTTGDLLQMWMALAGLWWLIALALILKFPEQPEFFKRREILAGLGVIALVPCGVSLNVLKSTPQAESLIVLLLMLIWSADIGAYFVGRRFGQRKLLPAVSPGKSVEGLFGGARCNAHRWALINGDGRSYCADARPCCALGVCIRRDRVGVCFGGFDPLNVQADTRYQRLQSIIAWPWGDS